MSLLRSTVVLLVLGAPACGGTVESEADDAAGVPDAQSDRGTSETVPLDRLCSFLADARCGLEAKKCCDSVPATYDAAGCRDFWQRVCQRDVDAVNAGRATYDEGKASQCAAAWRSGFSKCGLTLMEDTRLWAACGAMFKGTVAMGSPCESHAECVAPEGMAGRCGYDGKCWVVGVQSVIGGTCDGPQCALDAGLYCHFGSFTCRTNLALGSPCSDAEPQSCGLGAFCSGGTCVAGKPDGSACVETFECASWNCRLKKCQPDVTLLSNSLWCDGE